MAEGHVQFFDCKRGWDVVVDGKRVPHLEAWPKDGGKVMLICDRAFALEVDAGQAELVADFVSFAMQVAIRGARWEPVSDLEAPSMSPRTRTMARTESAVAWEMRRYWALGQPVDLILSERCMVDRIIGIVERVAVTGAFVIVDGWHVPTVDILHYELVKRKHFDTAKAA